MTDDDATIRPYDPDRDPEALWELKQAFERGLGSGTGSDDKRAAYEGKLTTDYGERYLDWVFWCTKHNPRCVLVAEVPDDGSAASDADDADAEPSEEESDDSLAGYAFVLPQQLAMIWDAAVLNEIFVRPEFRGTDLADDLMAEAVAVAREQDLPLDRLVLDVDRGNERARSFYERHGFERWGELLARELE